MSLARKIKRNAEKEELKRLRNLYGQKLIEKCPVCKRKTLFMKNKNKELYCVRCDKRVK